MARSSNKGRMAEDGSQIRLLEWALETMTTSSVVDLEAAVSEEADLPPSSRVALVDSEAAAWEKPSVNQQ